MKQYNAIPNKPGTKKPDMVDPNRSPEAQIREAISLIWRNTQPHTTFGPCPNGCKIAGRGCGPCIECAESALAKLTSRDVAKRYVMSVKQVRRIEGEMIR